MIIIDNERELLPVVRNPIDICEDFERLFMPIFHKFLSTQLTEDKYAGWAFSMVLLRSTNIGYQDMINSMEMKRSRINGEWTFAPSLKDRNESIWQNNETCVMIHQNSWLWFG